MVTGAAGFIGRNLSKLLTTYGHKLVLVDEMAKFLACPQSLYNVSFDRCVGPDDAKKLVASVDCVVHLGALSSTGETDLQKLVTNNVDYSISLVNEARLWGKGMVFVSSAGVYGNEATNDDRTFYTPTTAYGASKAIVDAYVRNLPFKKGLKSVVVVRPYNVYGLGEWTKPVGSQSFLYRAAWSIVNKSQMSYHSPSAVRDFVFVDDVSNAIRVLCDHVCREPVEDARRIFDIGTGRSPSIQEVVDFVCETWGIYFSFSDAVAPVSYQKHTRAAGLFDEYPFNPCSFLDWKIGLKNMVELMQRKCVE